MTCAQLDSYTHGEHIRPGIAIVSTNVNAHTQKYVLWTRMRRDVFFRTPYGAKSHA